MKYSVNDISGFIFINKPVGRTSFSVIYALKRLLPKGVCIGHSGTLDPFACGLLIVGISRSATRLMAQLQELDKKYQVMAQLGVLTDTLDITGTVLESSEVEHITVDSIKKSISLLQPSYLQIPPIYSACKYNGTALYDLARKNKVSSQELQAIAQSKQRQVFLYGCDLIAYQLPYFTLDVHVSHGTYIRTLVNDIANQMKSYAVACTLMRTQIGPWKVENALALNAIVTVDDIVKNLLSVEDMQQMLQ